MKIALHLLLCAVLVGGALARGESKPSVSNHSVENVRKPDFTIAGSNTNGTGVIAYNPNGRFLAVAAGDKVIRIYEAHSGDRVTAELFKTLTGHAAPIVGLYFSDTNTLVSISLDQTAKIWDVASGKLLHTVDLNLGKQIRVAIAPGHQFLAADSSSGKARLWNLQIGELLNTFEPNDSWASVVTFTPDGKLLAIGTEKGVLRVMDVTTWNVTRTIDLDAPIHSLAASADHILVGYGDGTVGILSLGDAPSVSEVRKQTEVINGLAFSPRGDRFASASADKTVKVWDMATLQLLCSLEGHRASVLSVAFSPDGQNLASIDADGNVNFWTVPRP